MNNFETLFAQFCQPGNRFYSLPSLTASAKAIGLSVEDIIALANKSGIRNRNHDIRRLWDGSFVDPNHQGIHHSHHYSRPPEQPLPPEEKRDFVPITLRNLGMGATSADIRKLSPVPIPTDITPHEAAALQLYALDQGCDFKVWVGTILNPDFAKANHRKVKDGTIWGVADIAERIKSEKRQNLPTHVSMLPLTGHEGLTRKGGSSFDCLATIAAYPFALLEFDDLSLTIQAEIVAGMIRHPNVGVVTVTYSGGKSLHTVIRLPPCPDFATYKHHWQTITALFASADDPRFRVDLSPATNPVTHVRLAGAIRPETGKRQQILYCATHAPDIF